MCDLVLIGLGMVHIGHRTWPSAHRNFANAHQQVY